MRTTEQTVLLNAAVAYMNLLRDTAIFDLQRSNVEVLQEQLRQTKQRLESGNVTATDVYQSESRLSVGRTQLYVAEANYRTARAAYRQVIGIEPGRLQPATSVDRFFPGSLAAVTSIGTAEHPTVATAQNNVDVALFQVKIAEGALYPTLSLLGSVQKNYDVALTTPETFTRVGGNPAFGADLSGRRRIFADPASQGNARPAAARSGSCSRPDPPDDHAGLGSA